VTSEVFMHTVQELAYVGVGARDVDAWRSYAVEVLGHEISPDSDAENLYLRMDDHHHRFIVNPSDEDDVVYIGWQVRDRSALVAIADRLDEAGVEVTPGSPEEAAMRRVLDFVHFTDPNSGTRMELSVGPELLFSPGYHPSRAISGYDTGAGGLGHYVTYVKDVNLAEEFYTNVLGFRTSDSVQVPGIGSVAGFMYCNPRHHSLAFFLNPSPRRRTNHIMLEHLSIDDVGTAYDICREHELVKVTLGRHNNDRAVSFYAENPSGWLFELGWGAREVDPASFAVEHYSMAVPGRRGEWGHEGLRDII
jgi:2,3-dihydroxybiphenyl 1,2-dioxygenase